METNYKKIFYAGIAYGTFPEDGRKLKKSGLPVKKLGREFPYLLGGGRAAMEKMQVYYALLPQYKGRTFTGRLKSWKPEMSVRLLEEAQAKSSREFNCSEQILAPELNRDSARAMPELMAVCLYRQRPFDKICVSLPSEGGEYSMQQALELLHPYLSRMRQVVLKGDESYVSEMLEVYLYEEFGIVMAKAGKILPDMPWLDLRENAQEGDCLKPQEKLRHISGQEALKFLDSAVKNGYNTEVNSKRHI